MSNWVTCGMVFQAWLRCSDVLRRMLLIGCRSMSPHLLKSGSGMADGAPPPAGRPDDMGAVRLIAGLLWPSHDHPRIALAPGGAAIAIADGEVVAGFRLDCSGRRIAASPTWRHALGLVVRELIGPPL